MKFHFFRTTRVLSLLVASTVAAVFAVRAFVPYEMLSTELWAVAAFLSFMGVVYAIVVGFTLLVTLNRFSALSSIIEEEANAIEVVRDYTNIYLEHDGDILTNLRTYTRSVLEKEWHQMAHNKEMKSDTSPELYALMNVFNKFELRTNKDTELFRGMLSKIEEISVLRTKRINLSNEKVPHLLRLFMRTVSVSLVLGTLLVAVQNPFINLFIVLAVTFAVLLIDHLISDLDQPFFGVWNIQQKAFREALEQL